MHTYTLHVCVCVNREKKRDWAHVGVLVIDRNTRKLYLISLKLFSSASQITSHKHDENNKNGRIVLALHLCPRGVQTTATLL